MIDINNFKHINDTYGHNMGTKHGGHGKSAENVPQHRDFIARYGGDEFCAVLDTSERDALESQVSRLRSCFEKYNEWSSILSRSNSAWVTRCMTKTA